ncbi:MAG: SCO family protein [Sphingomonadaceae bacterium]|nr:SCO family protein [Sphingomonadaceae bacterium]
MCGAAMNKTILTALSAALLLPACNDGPTQPPLSAAPLAGAAIGGEFTLTDQDGKKRTWKEFDGQYRIVYFGYTNCPDICTPDMQNLMAGLKAFEKASPDLAAKIQPIFITVDPTRDTPAVLKQFVSAFHPRAIGLTGSDTEIADATKKFAVFSSRVEGSTPESYLMSHSQTPYLMGPDGKPLAIMPADQPKTDVNEGAPKLVEAKLAKWVR